MNQTVANDDLVQFTQHCLQSVGLNPTDANTDSCPGGQRRQLQRGLSIGFGKELFRVVPVP